jgi:transposase
LRQVEGIGVLTALTLVLTLEDPYRFEKSRSVGAYLGLVPARDQSGDRDPREKRISKEGDEMLRKLLVGSAHYILGPFGSDSDLRRHGEKIASRGAKNAKKRAVVAVARKLSVLLHRLWVSAEVYDPLYNTHRHRGLAATEPPKRVWLLGSADRSIAREGHSTPLHSATDTSRHVGLTNSAFS